MKSFTRTPSRRTAIVIGAAGLAVAGAVGVGAAAFADGAPSPSTSQSPGATQQPGAPAGAPAGSPAAGPAGGPAKKHEPHIGGTVQTVSGSTVTVKDPDGFTRTVQLSGSVTVTKSGADSSVSAITAGTWIDATGTVDANGTTLDATAVSIGRPTPPAGGPQALGGPKAPGAAKAPKGEWPTPPAAGGSVPTAPAPSASSTPTAGS